ncbi:MAG: translation initiation factor IF-5A [Candidatus Micrarchaeaceae archaeon]
MDDAGSFTKKSVKELREGSYVLIDGSPCKIVSIEVSSPGKHGAAKVRLTGIGVFDSQKRTLLEPGDADVDVPEVKKKRAQVVAITATSVQLMDLETYEVYETNAQEDIRKSLKQGQEVEVLESMGKRAINRVLGN